jgi:hypothetical protein
VDDGYERVITVNKKYLKNICHLFPFYLSHVRVRSFNGSLTWCVEGPFHFVCLLRSSFSSTWTCRKGLRWTGGFPERKYMASYVVVICTYSIAGKGLYICQARPCLLCTYTYVICNACKQGIFLKRNSLRHHYYIIKFSLFPAPRTPTQCNMFHA